MRIGIATPTLIEGDAVGNDVMGMYITLKRNGHEPILFAEAAHIPFPSTPIQNIGSANLDLYIYHHSVQCDIGVKWFTDLNCKKVVKYHNITPPHFFSDPNILRATTKGLEQLHPILNTPCEIWVDSEYNGLELCKIKQCDFKIIPPYNQVDMLMRTEPNIQPVLAFDDWCTNILMVGRISPNKDILEGLEAFAQYQKRRAARLLIVGSGGGEYLDRVKAKISELSLSNLVITGKVDIDVLKAFYLVSDVLMITSKHEGFCVPMVEAMAMHLPVIANECCALPYTGGDAVYYANNPVDIANGIEVLLNNKSNYIEKGRDRFKEKYQNVMIESLLLSVVNLMAAK